jgi:hypothetical protein
MSSVIFSLVSCPSVDFSYKNKIFVSCRDFDLFTSEYQTRAEDSYINVVCSRIPLEECSKVYMMVPCDDMIDGTIGLNQLQRNDCEVLLHESITVRAFENSDMILTELVMKVEPLVRKNIDLSALDVDDLSVAFHKVYKNQFFHKNNKIAMDHNGLKLLITVLSIQIENECSGNFGKLVATTNLNWKKISGPIGVSTGSIWMTTGPTGPTGPIWMSTGPAGPN